MALAAAAYAQTTSVDIRIVEQLGQTQVVFSDGGSSPDPVLDFAVQIRVNGGKLRMNFATRQVTLDYRVEPSFEYSMPQQAARPYVGRYEFSWASEPGDTTPPKVSKMDLQYRNGSLKATFDPLPDPTMEEVLFFSIRPNWFRMATLEKGEVFDVWTEAVFEFALTNGRATGFEIRGDGDEVWGRAKRVR